MYIGYSRVSTSDQNPDLQLDALKKEECHQIFSDTASGAKTDRPGLDEALAFLRGGDTLVVWKLDRLGRSLKHLIEWPWSQVCMECPPLFIKKRGIPTFDTLILKMSRIAITAFI